MKQTHKFHEAFGQHLTIDGYGCNRAALADLLGVYQFLDRAPAEITMTKIMAPQVVEHLGGVIGFVIIAESHICIHTIPDKLYLSLDIFSCKKFDVNEATRMVVEQFKIARMEVNLLDRGLEFPRNKSMMAKEEG